MMETLQQQHCEVCRSGAPPATAAEIAGFLGQLPQWQILHVDGIDRLSRSFAFRNFRAALEFTDRVGALAEAEGHHPLPGHRMGPGDGTVVDPQDRGLAPQRFRHGSPHRRPAG